MASPQLENGFTRIANEILEKTATAKLTGTQYAIVLCVWRYSFGYQRKSCPLSVGFIEKATGLNRRGIQNEINALIKNNVLIVSRKQTYNSPREIAFQKDYSLWKMLPREQNNMPAVPEYASSDVPEYTPSDVPEYTTSDVPEYASPDVPEYTQERKVKENINTYMCKSDLNEPFNRFWEAYPKRQAKQEALKAFRKLNPNDELIKVITEAIKRQTITENWQRNNGLYIPLPATYLNGRRWEDEIPTAQFDVTKQKRKFLN